MRNKSVLVVVVFLLATLSPAFAAPHHPAAPRAEALAESHGWWSSLLALFGLDDGRGTLDPNGSPRALSNLGSPGRGTLDPNGNPLPPVTTDGRGTLDPNG
jgi:hypothetical protein